MSVAPLKVAREAMATRFEIALFGGNPVSLRAAAEEALDEVQRIEAMLSWRKPTSPAAHVNARAAHEPVRVNPEFFQLLQQCRELWETSGRAFDITVGPLMRAWGFHADDGRPGDAAALVAAREACGMQHVELDAANYTVRFARPGMRLDFGAIGKGYALELATGILRDAGITSALLHGGTSTVSAIGHPPEAEAWKIAVEYPPGVTASPGETLPVLAVMDLRDAALSVSAVWGRVFRVGADSFGHVIDPRTGRPAQGQLLSVFIGNNATHADALSTALLTDGGEGWARLREAEPEARMLVLGTGGRAGEYAIQAHGIAWQPLPLNSSVASPSTNP